MIPSTEAETASVARLVSGICSNVPKNFGSVPPVPPGTPSIPASWPIATWMPTPVRNPINTLRDRKSARNPSRISLARSNSPAQRIAVIPASET